MAARKGNKYAKGNKGGGRKTVYDPAFVEIAKKACEAGFTDRELAQCLRVSEVTLNQWKLDHKEFSLAIRTGKAGPDDRVERSFYHRAVGYTYDAVKVVKGSDDKPVLMHYTEHVPPDTTAGIFWLKNRRKEQWRDSYAHTGPDGGAIQIEALETAMAKMNDKELAAFEKLIGPIAAAMRVTPGVAPGGRARKTPTEH